MKKMRVFFLAFVFMISLGKASVSASSDMGELAEDICRKAGWEMSGVYSEAVDKTNAFAFGIAAKEFEDRVETAVCLRESVDSKGRALYVFEADEIHIEPEFFGCDGDVGKHNPKAEFVPSPGFIHAVFF